MRVSLRLTAMILVVMAAAIAFHLTQAQSPGPSIGRSPDPSAPSLSARANPMIHQAGTRIVAPNGAPLKLRGVNLGGWLAWEGWIFGRGPFTPQSQILAGLTRLVGLKEAARFRDAIYKTFISAGDLDVISRLGFNVVRIPINRRLLEDDAHPFSYRPAGWAILDNALAWCEQRHVYAVLDLHAVPGGQAKEAPADPGDDQNLVWRSAENQRRTIALWRALAQRYKDRQIVAGYDLINEPVPPNGQELVGLYRRIIHAIREVDPHHLVFLEGARFATDFSMFAAPLSDNQAYSFHMYTWQGDDRRTSLAAYKAVAARDRVPLWVGEYGENSYDMIASTIEMFEATGRELSGWAYWTWKKVSRRYPGLVSIQISENWGSVMNWIAFPTGYPMPSPEQTRQGMKEFLQAIRIENMSVDQRMVELLTGPGRRKN